MISELSKKIKESELMNPFKIPYINLTRQYFALQQQIDEKVTQVLREGSFILRDDVTIFERKMADYIGVKHVIGLNSGTDALILSLKALGVRPGDEIITVAHTFVATVAAIVHCGATPVLVDIGPDMNMDPEKAEAAITSKTKGIIPVHMNGKLCRMNLITSIAKRHGLWIVEDACQSMGAQQNGKMAGSFGRTGCFSLHPMKILNVAGDGGFVATDDDDINEYIRLMRNHGQKTKEEISFFGFSSRLDNLQAAIATIKLEYLEAWIETRRRLAAAYDEGLKSLEMIQLQKEDISYRDVYNSYVVRCSERDALFHFLREHGVECMVHWPRPLHKQPALKLDEYQLPETEKMSSEVLSLPIYPELTLDELQEVISHVIEFAHAE